MIRRIKGLVGDSSVRNSASLMFGTGISQLIPLIVSPLLARIYSPSDFGDLAIFMAATAIASIISAGLYDYAIVIPEDDLEAVNIVGGIMLLTFLFQIIVLLCLLSVSFFYEFDFFYWLLPIAIIFTVSFNIMSNWLNRFRNYKKLNYLRILQAISIVIGSLVFYDFHYGLIYGFLIGGVCSMIFFIVIFMPYLKEIRLYEIKRLLHVHRKFPIVVMPTTVMNTLSSYAPIFMIKRSFSSHILGSYSLSSRVLTAPISVISTAVGQVYFKNLSEFENQKDYIGIKRYFYKTAKILCLLSIIIFAPLFFFGEELTVIIFGDKWREAGRYIEIVSLASMVKFIVSPLSMLLIVRRQLGKLSRWQAIYFFTSLTIFVIGSRFGIIPLLWIYFIHETIMYSFYYVIINSAVKS